ncbi:MAG: hypothetical protein J0H42_04320 [Rhizobiales bacterium]|nr:hypothetical protein [Hyphomicrobiales bacterium]
MKFSLQAQIEEIDRELEQRARVYPRLTAKGELRKSVGDYQIQRLEAVRATLVWLQQNETRIKETLGIERPAAAEGGTQ